jgi:hypothetical protein
MRSSQKHRFNMSFRPLPILLFAIFWIGCGGGSSTPAPANPAPSPGTSNGGNLTTPVPVTVASGQAISGVNIVVPNTASAFNVTLLGANSPSATTGSASNVGGTVARGSSALMLIFGPGLSGTQTLTISGPNDIAISGERSVKATDGTPGIQFLITVGSDAAVGARTLNVTSGSNASSFVGGIEVF